MQPIRGEGFAGASRVFDQIFPQANLELVPVSRRTVRRTTALPSLRKSQFDRKRENAHQYLRFISPTGTQTARGVIGILEFQITHPREIDEVESSCSGSV
jgi:hypothetical protein